MAEKEKMRKNLFKCFDKQKSKAKPVPLLEQIMKTYLTDELMDAFNVKEKKRKYLKKLLAEQTKETGNQESKKSICIADPTIPALNMAHEIMRQNAERCPITHMSRFLEQDVKSMIKGKHLEKKYAKIVDSMIMEIREIFITMTHEAGVNLKVKPSDGIITRFQPEPYKYLGKTNRYNIFLRHRDELKSKWVSFYPLVKKIHIECIDRLSDKIIDIGVFHYTEVFHLSDLSQKFSDLAAYVSRTLNLLRDKIISYIESDKTKVKITHMKHYYDAITTLQTIHVSNCITRILEHIIEVSGCERRVPFLMLTIKFEDGLVLKPSPSETSVIYQQFMRELVAIGGKYQTVEKKQRMLIDRKIHLNVIPEYFDDAVARMTANTESLYESVLKYVEYLDSQFCEIYQAINRTSLSEDSKNFTFENGCALIQHYLDYLKKATDMECNENFPIGQLVLSEYIKTMKLSLTMVIEEIFIELCNLHQLENEKVCQVFEEVARIALKKPLTTEELIEQGKYMIQVKTVILAELRQRIQVLLNGLATIVDYGNLTSEHMALNAKTIRWLYDIQAVLDQNSAMYEGMKYEAEEKVHNSIGNIKKKINELIPQLHIFNQMDDLTMARQYILQLAPIMEKIKDIKQQIEWTNREEGCLGFALSQYPEYTALVTFVHTFYHLVKMCLNLMRKITVWLDGQFEFLSFDETEMYIEDINKEFLKSFKLYKNKIRQAHQENSPLKFKGIADDVDSNNWPAPLKLCSQALQQVKDFRPAMTMMRIMCNDALLKRHWKDMSEIAKFDLTPNAGTSLRKMMHMGLEGDIDQYDVISNGATKERELLNNLTKMKAEWQDITFKVGQYKETKLPILTALDDVQVILDDHIIKALTMRGSVFVKPYEAEVKDFYAKLVRVNSTIEEWGKVQSQWLYLLPIFSSKDIVAQMPEEGVLFREVNDTFKKYMEAVVLEPRVMETAGSMGVLEAMVHCLELLEQINEGVTNYLERKRLFFPRFFFLSNDEMLEILSETKDPLRVQPHLKKCFEAINSLNSIVLSPFTR
ncbi:hypothetical protein WA026_007766 [Henosepilachna vigintioctopunctata]|uniref:Dynein heavy chain linker domain-containing protein n=1 Tax=Henosepilachna vigintioctopunctata TaxID=420089 RepID=A0AAW1U645_9CUCU